MPEIQSLSYRHEAIINWLIANPDRHLYECAAELGYTQAWLSIIIHSDAFQDKLRERQDAAFSATVADIRTKLTAISHVSLDRLAEMISTTSDPSLLLSVADKSLHRLGYAPSSAATHASQTNNTININVADPSTLAEARALLSRAHQLSKPPRATTEPPILDSPAEVPAIETIYVEDVVTSPTRTED